MSGKMDWRKARKYTATDEKYAPGKILENGRKVPNAPRDSLDARAKAAEHEWLSELGRKKARKKRFFKNRQQSINNG